MNEDQKISFLSFVVENISDAFIICDTGFAITYINKATEQLYGYTMAEIAGKTPIIFNAEPIAEQIQQELYKTVASGKTHFGKSLNIKKDGSTFYCEYKISPLKNNDGIIIAYVGIQRDITENKKIEDSLWDNNTQLLNKSLSELQSKNADLLTVGNILKDLKEKHEEINNQLKLEVARANAMTMAADQASIAKNTFLANIGHELRSPLNDIVGFSEILLNKNDIAPENQKSYIETIYKRTQDLLVLVNDLLDISKIEAGKLSLSYETIKFKRLINEVANSFAKEIQNKKIKYNVSIEKNVPKYLVTDPFRLKQILTNLIGNAIKFTDSGEINLYVVKVINKDLDLVDKVELEICVSDTGIGIPKHNQSELFKPFSQVQDTSQKQYGGTGLGLAISMRLVKMMDGHIKMEDNTPKGSRFCFTIIANKVTEKHIYPIIDDNFLKNKVNEILNKRIITLLIVEDQTTSMDILRVNITKKSEKIKLILVVDGQEAMAIYNQGKVDAILTDIVMPNMDGFALIQQIRYVENKTNKHTPIIAMTASASESDKKRCLDAGADFYITKPIYKSDLYKILDIMIEKYFG
jgi:PAS domain S-box-containing protein